MNPPPGHRPTWAEIDLDALAFNFRSVKSFIGDDISYMAVVKADAYGHGAVPCAKKLVDSGADWLAVATVEEGAELREAQIAVPILILGGYWPGQEVKVLNLGLTPVVFRVDQAESIAAAAARQATSARIHVKIDTGMGRVGFRHGDLKAVSCALAGIENLEVEGIMTHFAVADKLDQTEFTNQQITAFAEAIEAFHAQGHRPTYIDMANSPGAVVHPLSRSKMVRIGGLLFGLGGDVLPDSVAQPDLKPVMALRSRVGQLKKINAGETVGYGRTFIAEKETLIATVPIGYHDGLPRSLSNEGHFIVNGRRAPIAGRVSMDWTTIDVTNIPDVSVGDDVTIIGGDGDETIRAEDLAQTTATISYEITCGISGRVPRLYQPPYQ